MEEIVERRMLAEYLAGRDQPCPGCGYNLRDLTGERCPECNQELCLRVGLMEPRHVAYLAGMCGLLAGVGMAVVFLGFAVYMSMRFGGPPRSMGLAVFGIPVAAAVVLGLGAWGWSDSGSRTWLRSASSGARVLAVLGCWGATILAIVLFLWAVVR